MKTVTYTVKSTSGLTVPAGDYKPGQEFDADGRRWAVHAVAHTGKTLQARCYGFPFRDETFKITPQQNEPRQAVLSAMLGLTEYPARDDDTQD